MNKINSILKLSFRNKEILKELKLETEDREG